MVLLYVFRTHNIVNFLINSSFSISLALFKGTIYRSLFVLKVPSNPNLSVIKLGNWTVVGRFAQLRILLGDFKFSELQQANCILGPTYFVLFVFFTFFVLLNMFLAIVNDAYSEVKAEMSRQKHEFEMIDFFKKVRIKPVEFWYRQIPFRYH